MKRAAFGLLTALMLVCGLLPVTAVAQQGTPPHLVWAEQYNQWTFQSAAANTYTFPGSNCWVTPATDGQTASFFAFGNPAQSVYYPVAIIDATPANSEIVTPTSLSTSPSACGFSASTVNSHASFYVESGTAGLQEAVYTLSQPSSGNVAWVVGLDRTYYSQVAGLPGSQTVGGIIYNLKGSAGVQIVDTTTTPYTWYAWNGAHYFANGGGTPSIAAGAALGTGPANLTITGTGASGTISVTTGTSTATGTMFTLTFLSGTTSTGFNHSPTCTIASVGATTPSGTLAAGSVGGSSSAGYTQPFTVSTTALTASTFYSFSYSCK